MGILYIVSTPIGNLQDIGVRAVKILIEVDIIACEDTRKTGFLLEKIKDLYMKLFSLATDIKRQNLVSYYEQNEEKRIPEIINFLKEGRNVALVSDAGTPAISDPGFKLIRECIKQGIKVESIPGPSSVISSLVVSGLPTDKFLFAGYPPKKPGHRKIFFTKLKQAKEKVKLTLIIFEAPHKLLRTLDEIKEIFGDVDLVLARELTKTFEEVKRDNLSSLISYFEKKSPKGEFVILL
ncbi:MAG: 16S rRNA (cytidine(1402)-2'-O)-methyltransferase [Candidatus Levybacteria bacterium RIFCSPLOWO2_01_FULL_38_21]|nr:MAG: 16S rRNA (cytidine(1402)-2'-O)-methyltransferase [Candidatus Levybacteria bacterium RIFCSPLOWO2_01_FULL_38_21]